MKSTERRCCGISGIIYLCATPIGNLGDITERVLSCLKTVDLIAAEDTRNSMKLMSRFDIHVPLTSYHKFNAEEKAEVLLKELLAGKNIALISDAGTPVISDPGEVLVRRCIESGIQVTSLPGACAAVTALTLSGLPARRFSFEGFLPEDRRLRRQTLEELKEERRTMVLYEAPHRLKKTLAELKETLGNREAALCRELTKIHEEVLRLSLEEAVEYYRDREPRGEYVLVIAGKSREEAEADRQESFAELPVADHVRQYESRGLNRKEAMREAAKDRGVSRREIYRALLEEEGQD